MKELKFNSQICTTREQSQRLLGLGLKPETADMVYHFTDSRVEVLQWELQTKPPTMRGEFWTEERIARLAHRGECGEEVFNKIWGKDIPAWSLNRLLEIIPRKIKTEDKREYLLHIETDEKHLFYSYEEETIFFILYTNMCKNLFEGAISVIEWLVEKNMLNKDYVL